MLGSLILHREDDIIPSLTVIDKKIAAVLVFTELQRF